MKKYYITILNDERATPLFVERGLGFGGVKLTGDERAARRYDTQEEAEKIAAIARNQKDKETGAETTTVQIIEEECGDAWDVRARFELPASGAESRFEMKKTGSGIVSRYVGMNGSVSQEYSPADVLKAVSDWTNSVGAWFAAKVKGAKK